MKSKILLSTAFALFCVGSVLAQPKADGIPKAILQADQLMSDPVWSPDGKKLAVTSIKGTGIWTVDANGKNLQQITQDLGAGYKMAWSADNSTILAKPFVVENNRRYFSVKSYDVNSKAEKTIVGQTRALKGTPYFSSDNSSIIYNLENKEVKSTSGVKTRLASAPKAESLYQQMLADPGNVTLQVAGLKQFANHTLINPTLSPKGDKIAFQIVGKGLFVCNTDASEIKSLGRGEGPTWMPDGEYVVVFKSVDDGVNVTKSTLHSVNVKTGEYTELLNSNLVALSPNVSADGNKVAFEDHATGAIYVLNLK